MSAVAQVSVRMAQAADAARLELIGRATFLDSYATLLPADDIVVHAERQHSRDVYAAWLADARYQCWLAECAPGSAPVGYLVLSPPDLPFDLRPTDLEVKRIYLLHQFQSGGIGRRLMQAATACARLRGATRLLLGVYSRNEAALGFYRKIGFARVGKRRFKVGAGEYHDYILGMELTT
jgi:diamine N-acetyltransferase